MPSSWPLLGALALTCHCSAATSGTAPPAPPPAAIPAATSPQPPSAPPAPIEQPTPGNLERSFTGQADPSVTIKNAFATPQHLFIDWVAVGILSPGDSQTFRLSTGTHTITSSESPDPDNHPASITEAFTPGYAYRYAITPR
jgi:hypothetical protein